MTDALDPGQAKARFGDLIHPSTRTYREFEDPVRRHLAAGVLRGEADALQAFSGTQDREADAMAEEMTRYTGPR